MRQRSIAQGKISDLPCAKPGTRQKASLPCVFIFTVCFAGGIRQKRSLPCARFCAHGKLPFSGSEANTLKLDWKPIPSRIGALLWIVIVIWSSPSHPPLLAASCAHRLLARLGLASHTYPPRWHAVRHGFVFLGASLLYYSCCMRDETGEHASWDRHPMQSHVMGSQATRANNPGSSTPFYFTLHADL